MDKKEKLTKFEQQTRDRISKLIQEECDGSQQRFADKTGLNKASVSQYVNGRNTPSNLTAKRIADAFGVNPAWVMGFDVPMYDMDDIENKIAFQRYLDAKPAVQFMGQQDAYYMDEEARELAEFLFHNPEYKALFDASRKVKPEDMEFVRQMIERMGGTD